MSTGRISLRGHQYFGYCKVGCWYEKTTTVNTEAWLFIVILSHIEIKCVGMQVCVGVAARRRDCNATNDRSHS